MFLYRPWVSVTKAGIWLHLLLWAKSFHCASDQVCLDFGSHPWNGGRLTIVPVGRNPRTPLCSAKPMRTSSLPISPSVVWEQILYLKASKRKHLHISTRFHGQNMCLLMKITTQTKYCSSSLSCSHLERKQLCVTISHLRLLWNSARQLHSPRSDYLKWEF
jgi:hypothetical protein